MLVCGQYGKQLQCNYQLSKLAPKSLEGSRLTDSKVRSSSLSPDVMQGLETVGSRFEVSHFCCLSVLCVQSRSEASLVAMDFSGKAGGRVIQSPTEAQNAEREEGQAWRVSSF